MFHLKFYFKNFHSHVVRKATFNQLVCWKTICPRPFSDLITFCVNSCFGCSEILIGICSQVFISTGFCFIFSEVFKSLTVCFCYVTYAFQSESTLYSCLYVRPVWLNGWVFVYDLSRCGFECNCCHFLKYLNISPQKRFH